MNKENKQALPLFQKLKSIKHFEIIIAVLFCAILLVIYVSSFSSNQSTKTDTTSLTTEEYATFLENKLATVLSNVKGAGKVSVMVTLECGIEYVYATESEEQTNTTTSGSNTSTKTTTSENILFVTSSGKSVPVVLKENLPKVSGVLVVANGASDISIRLELMNAVTSLLGVDAENVQILVGTN
ncbi:MAG: hypothetical protein IJA69_03835 [Clostridia bacterium]|nr:hypothetical protein [Clostridia bacterium]